MYIMSLVVALTILRRENTGAQPTCAVPVCSCIWETDPLKARAGAAAVIEVTTIDSLRPYFRIDTAAPPSEWIARVFELHRVRVVVDRVWKGTVSDTLFVFTGEKDGGCGFPFEPGEHYLLFLDRVASGNLVATYCSMSRPWKDAAPIVE